MTTGNLSDTSMEANELALFGRWLKQRREALDLTQLELAGASGCSLSTIRKIELGLRRPSKQVAALLASCLEIGPEERDVFMHFARANPQTSAKQVALPSLPAAPSALARHQSLPAPEALWSVSAILPTPLASFIGRKKTLEQIRSLLWRLDIRMLTLTGPPGIGKTRLAIEVASSLVSDFMDGVRFISLAPISDPNLVLPKIAQLLTLSDTGGTPLEAALAEYLRGKNILLLLDNFEQVVEAAPALSRVMQAAPGVKALITSRVPLGIYGEHEVNIPPMRLPDRKVLSVRQLEQFESIQLFAHRAHNADPDFRMTSAHAQTVAEICRRLDGLPLAIELAAARCRLYSPADILSRLEDRFAFLAGTARDAPIHQRTLHAAIDWSYNLLNESERRLFRCIGVFAGGFTVEAACAVGAPSALPILVESLADKNMLTRRLSGPGAQNSPPTRYRMLMTIREYALKQLAASGEEKEARLRHAQYYLALAEQANANIYGPDQAAWLDRLELEHDNLRAALGWLLHEGHGHSGLTGQALLLAATLHRFWYSRGYITEARRWLDRALNNANAIACKLQDIAFRTAHARVLDSAGWLARTQGDYQQAHSYFESGLALSRDLKDKEGIAHRLNGLAQLALDRLDYKQALALYSEALDLARQSVDKLLMARTLNNMAGAFRNTGDYEGARRYYLQSAALFQELGDKGNLATPLINLALLAMDVENYAEARRYQSQALALSRELGHKESLAFLLAFVGQRAVEEGDFAEAERAYAEALPLVRDLDYKLALAICLEGLAIMWAKLGKPAEAVGLWAGAHSIRQAIAAPLPTPSRARYEQRLGQARTELGEEAFEAVWEQGLVADSYLSAERGAPSSELAVGSREGKTKDES